MKRVLLGVAGSIAAYHAAGVASGLVNRDVEVHVAMTKAGASFITPLTMQSISKNRVFVDTLQEEDPSEIVHVALPQRCDLLLIAPATANIIAKIAHGIADDMLTSMVLAAYDIPKIVAPAMNTRMYENPATQANLEILKSRGWQVIEPREARLACGVYGKGALEKVEVIVATALKALGEAP